MGGAGAGANDLSMIGTQTHRSKGKYMCVSGAEATWSTNLTSVSNVMLL